MLLGSIEAGGTKFVCAVGDEDYRIHQQLTIPTTTPEETLAAALAFFQEHPVEALGIASFGPIETRRHAENYGFITSTPKPGWQNTDIVGPFKKALGIPVAFTTDVNGSAYGEYQMSTFANEKIQSLVYYTVGTGVGGGAIQNGEFIGSLGHPEMGHTFVKRHPEDQDFAGICPFHGDCLEGLVAGPTFPHRTGKKGEDVALDDPVWTIYAYYLAQAVLQVSLTLRPEKIIFGGSVANEHLVALIRTQVLELNHHYIPLPPLEQYISTPAIANNGSATLGNFALALAKAKS